MDRNVCIIAEAGVNHNGDFLLAKKMVDVAKECGADIIKFQTIYPDKLVSRYTPMAEYQRINTGKEETQLEMLKKLTLKETEFIELETYCKERKIVFLSTPFDIEGIDFLKKFSFPFWKIPSGEITNYPYLVELGKTKVPVVMSTGMCNDNEIQNAMKVLSDFGCPKITLLQCNTEYPTPYEDVNLSAMQKMHEKYGVDVGYSDHTLGIEVSLAAVALGASILEKHFTLDKSLEGPDHISSLEPQELREMIKAVRNVEKALGNGNKKAMPSEIKNIEIARKSIVARREIKEGELFSEENITVKRPGSGISPMRWNEILGKIASKTFQEDELIEL